MKKQRIVGMLLVFVLCAAFLTACGGDWANDQGAEQADPPAETETKTEPDGSTDEQASVTLEELLGEDYVSYLTETITMQMENRMEKDPDVRYFPIEDNAPLSDYVTIDETTTFEVDEVGDLVIRFPAGEVTDAANGEQSFRIPKLES